MSSDAPTVEDFSEPDRGRHFALPAILFVATCLSTFWLGAANWNPTGHLVIFRDVLQANWPQHSPLAALREAWAVAADGMNWRQGLVYMGLVMGLLLAHEMGHFLMTVRYRIPASLPYFIPVPIIPFGTLGAVIGMDGSRVNRREMFDLGIAGPLAGLAVTLPIVWLGILRLPATPLPPQSFCFHNPWILQHLIAWIRPSYPTPDVLYLNQFNPFLMAGWVGLLVTGLNMLPVSLLDGGHVAYALLGRRAHLLARADRGGDLVHPLLGAVFLGRLPRVGDFPGRRSPAHSRRRLPAGLVAAIVGLGIAADPVSLFPGGGITPMGR